MTPLERAARAVADYTKQRIPPPGDIVTCEGIARAALEAIKYEDGTDEDTLIDVSTEHRVEAVSLALAWDALIDAALNESVSSDR